MKLWVGAIIMALILVFMVMPTEHELKSHAFRDIWAESPEHRERARDLLRQMSLYCSQHRIRYFISYGTLLGFVRHKQLIPWDDDLDCNAFPEFVDAIRRYPIAPETSKYTLYQVAKNWYKLYHKDGESNALFPWKWPFLDIFIAQVDPNDLTQVIGLDKPMPVNAILPIRTNETFEDTHVSVPSDPKEFLDIMYPGWSTHYDSGSWDHRNERPRLHQFRVLIDPAIAPASEHVQ